MVSVNWNLVTGLFKWLLLGIRWRKPKKEGLRLKTGHLLSPAACFWHCIASQIILSALIFSWYFPLYNKSADCGQMCSHKIYFIIISITNINVCKKVNIYKISYNTIKYYYYFLSWNSFITLYFLKDESGVCFQMLQNVMKHVFIYTVFIFENNFTN